MAEVPLAASPTLCQCSDPLPRSAAYGRAMRAEFAWLRAERLQTLYLSFGAYRLLTV